MTLINLTEKYLSSFNPPPYERIRTVFGLDYYWASSLSAIENFKENPPKKKSKLNFKPSAYIIIENLEVKNLSFSLLEIKDMTMRKIAFWMESDLPILNSLYYLRAKKEFGLNKESYVLVPLVLLQYWQNDEEGLLAIRLLDKRTKPKKEKKSLKDKILELLPEFSSSFT